VEIEEAWIANAKLIRKDNFGSFVYDIVQFHFMSLLFPYRLKKDFESVAIT
jgi:hypothetical protein